MYKAEEQGTLVSSGGKCLFFLAVSVILLLANYCIAQRQAKPVDTAGQQFTYKLIAASHRTWGYDIYAGNKLLIHQPAIPAMPGNNGFKTPKAARKIAVLMIKKLKLGIMPPIITLAEMKALHAF